MLIPTVPLNYNFIFNARSCVVPRVYYSESRHVFACNTFKALFVMNTLHGIHACKVKIHACTIQARGNMHAKSEYAYTYGVETCLIIILFTIPGLIGKLESVAFHCKLQFFNIAAKYVI